uniref:Ethanolamine kinase n=1 Tax=Panagrolaimus davidi TaxID=227884 RepID=A0A914QLC3_9BILA
MSEARQPPMAKEIARNFARIHSLNIPICKLSNFMDFIDDWFFKLSTNPKTPEFFAIPEWYHSHSPKQLTLSKIKEEIEFIRSKFQILNKNVVFCHNDLLGGNILLDHDNPNPSKMPTNFKPKLMFIDFEFATYNPRGFDLADHFAKYAYDYSVKSPPYTDLKKLASEKEMFSFMHAYVEEFYPNFSNEEKIKEANELLKVCFLTTNLY